jgi:hypothetical protein
MAEDAAEPGSRKDPHKIEKAGQRKVTLTGFFYSATFVRFGVFKYMESDVPPTAEAYHGGR